MCPRRYVFYSKSALVLMTILVISCHCEETFLTGISTVESPVVELNRQKREISVESLRRIKVFDHDAVFLDAAGYASKKENTESVTNLEDENTQVTTTQISANSMSLFSLCCDLQKTLGKNIADFTQCAVINARPIRLCRRCVTPFNNTISTYQTLMSATENATKCRDVLFGKDKIGIAETMYDNVVNLWNQGNCYSCYAEKDGAPNLAVLSNQTLDFFEASSNVTECFEEIRFLNENMNDTCSECKELYQHLAALYSRILTKLNNQPADVCADIADAMNITHHLWNNQFKCRLFDKDIGYATFVLTGSLSAVPILFYLAAKILSNTETILLVLPKRKSFVQDRARLQM